jgi:hypothetical protein
VALTVLEQPVDMEHGHVRDAQAGIRGNGNKIGKVLSCSYISVIGCLVLGWTMMNIAGPFDRGFAVPVLTCFEHRWSSRQ